MRDYKAELENRIQFVRDLLKKTGAKGIIFGNSGGKDSALVGRITAATPTTRTLLQRSLALRTAPLT